MTPLTTAFAYPQFPFVYNNLFKAATSLMNEMRAVERRGCLSDQEYRNFRARVERLEIEFDQQLQKRGDGSELFSGHIENSPAPKGFHPFDESADPLRQAVPVSGNGALGVMPNYLINYARQALDEELATLKGLPVCKPEQPPVTGDLGPPQLQPVTGPFPPPHPPVVEHASAVWTNPFIGGQLAGNWSHVTTNEFSADTGERTNHFN